MSIIISNLKKPDKCAYCPLGRYYFENGNLWCNALNKIIANVPYENRLLDSVLDDVERPDSCPIEEVPNSHGDLVDLKDVELMLEKANIISDGEYSGYCTEDVDLDKLPVAVKKEI